MADGYTRVYADFRIKMLGLRHQHRTEHKVSEDEQKAIEAGKLEKYQAICAVCGYPAIGACYAPCHKPECKHKP